MANVLPIRVTPRSAKPGIGGWREGADGREELDVKVAEAPTDRAANDAVVKLLAKALGISRRALIYKLQRFRELGYEVDPAK